MIRLKLIRLNFLFENYSFSYILSAIFFLDPLEKLFGQARQRCGGNFYIDIADILVVMRMQILHQLLKRDLLPDPCSTVRYPSCTLESTFEDIDVLQSLHFSATLGRYNEA